LIASAGQRDFTKAAQASTGVKNQQSWNETYRLATNGPFAQKEKETK
jgi:hypothetical protein